MNGPLRGTAYQWARATACVAMSAGFALLAGCGGAPAPPPGDTSESSKPAGSGAPTQSELRDALDRALARDAGWSRRTDSEEDPDIAEHVNRLQEELPPDEAAARLSALGNLLVQKRGDYAAAAGYYELAIQQYPDWEGISSVYRALIDCYKALNQHTEARAVYRRILDNFPDDSEEYRFAKEALGH